MPCGRLHVLTHRNVGPVGAMKSPGRAGMGSKELIDLAINAD